MSVRIRQFPDPLLKQVTQEVGRLDERVHRLIETLVATMRHAPRCVGLAAPQIGSRLRVAVIETSHSPKPHASHGLLILVNPRVMAVEGSVCQREGCLSIPDLTANVHRATRVHLRAIDQEGKVQEWFLEGFESIVAQHEVDHLDGTLFLDRVANLKTDIFRRKTYL